MELIILNAYAINKCDYNFEHQMSLRVKGAFGFPSMCQCIFVPLISSFFFKSHSRQQIACVNIPFKPFSKTQKNPNWSQNFWQFSEIADRLKKET